MAELAYVTAVTATALGLSPARHTYLTAHPRSSAHSVGLCGRPAHLQGKETPSGEGCGLSKYSLLPLKGAFPITCFSCFRALPTRFAGASTRGFRAGGSHKQFPFPSLGGQPAGCILRGRLAPIGEGAGARNAAIAFLQGTQLRLPRDRTARGTSGT